MHRNRGSGDRTTVHREVILQCTQILVSSFIDKRTGGDCIAYREDITLADLAIDLIALAVLYCPPDDNGICVCAECLSILHGTDTLRGGDICNGVGCALGCVKADLVAVHDGVFHQVAVGVGHFGLGNVWIVQDTLAAIFGGNGGTGQSLVRPSGVHFKVATGQQALIAAGGPCVRQGGQQIDKAHIALQEHLSYASGVTEVAVDLEWSVVIP